MLHYRTIRHHAHADDAGVSIDDQAVRGCSFTLHQNGGCGAAEVRLGRDWTSRFDPPDIRVGDLVSIGMAEHRDGSGESDRWYLGSVTRRVASLPAGLTLHLEGLSEDLGRVMIGDGTPQQLPFRCGKAGLFRYDPDISPGARSRLTRLSEVIDALLQAAIAQRQMRVRVQPQRIHVAVDPELDDFTSYGEESLRSMLKEIAVRIGNAAWGVDEHAGFYLHRPEHVHGGPPSAVRLRVGREITQLTETETHEGLFNRVQLTGGYIYDRPVQQGQVRRNYPFRVQYHDAASIDRYGDRRLRINAPWIRTDADARRFLRPFFDRYARPEPSYRIEAVLRPGTRLPRPWRDPVEIESADGDTLIEAYPATVRVQLDQTPVVSMELGREDPRRLWAEPPHDQRQPRPDHDADHHGGGPLDPPGNDGSSSQSGPPTSDGPSSGGPPSGGPPSSSGGPSSSVSPSGVPNGSSGDDGGSTPNPWSSRVLDGSSESDWSGFPDWSDAWS